MPDFPMKQAVQQAVAQAVADLRAERSVGIGGRAGMPALYAGTVGQPGEPRLDPLVFGLREAKWSPQERPKVTLQPQHVYRESSFPAQEVLGGVGPGAVTPLGTDRRFLAPFLTPGPPLGDGLVVRDFVQVGSRDVTGSVERDPTSVSPKATLEVSVDLAFDPTKQLAILIEDIPNAIVANTPVFQAWLGSEMRFQIDLALDAHVIAQITAANPPSGQSGSDLISQVRNAVAAMRDLGASPNLLVLNGTDAAALDLATQPGAGGDYIFAPRGGASPIFSLRVIETPGSYPAMLVDSSMLGALYTGPVAFASDPFGDGFKANTTDFRLEGPALYHIRNKDGAYIIEATS